MIKLIFFFWLFKRRKDGYVCWLGIVFDGVISVEVNLLGNGMVLFLGFSKFLFGLESFVVLLKILRLVFGCVMIFVVVECFFLILIFEIFV